MIWLSTEERLISGKPFWTIIMLSKKNPLLCIKREKINENKSQSVIPSIYIP